MDREKLTEKLVKRTGIAADALNTLPESSLRGAFARSVSPGIITMQLMAASPLLMTALFTLGTGRLVAGGVMAFGGVYLCLGAKGRYEANLKATRDLTQEMALRLS